MPTRIPTNLSLVLLAFAGLGLVGFQTVPNDWDEMLQAMAHPLIKFASPEDGGKSYHRNEPGALYTSFESGDIRFQNWGENSPQTIGMIICNSTRVNQALGAMYVQRNAPRGALKLVGDNNVITLKPGIASQASTDASTPLLINFTDRPFADCKRGAGYLFPIDSLLISVDVMQDDQGTWWLLAWQAQPDWILAERESSKTDCWIVKDARSGFNAGKRPELEGIRGDTVVLTAFAAPGGRLFYGMRHMSGQLWSNDKEKYYSARDIQWGHGFVSLHHFNDKTALGAALISNGIPLSGKLIGWQKIELLEGQRTQISLQNSHIRDFQQQILRECPITTRK